MNNQQLSNNKMNRITHFGPFIVDVKHAHNSYLIQYSDLKILIDIPPIQVFDLLKTAIEKEISLSMLTHLIVQNMTMSSINVLSELIKYGFNGIILTNQYFARQIENANLNVKIQTIEEIEYKFIDHNELIFKFVPMGFLPYPEMFMTYMPTQYALFSSTLFSSFYDEQISPSLDHLQKNIFAFHKYTMPSSLYLQPPLRKIQNLNIQLIYPLMGYLISKQIFKVIYEYEQSLDFYNNYQVFTYSESGDKEVNYREILNHMLNQLQKSVSRIEILNAFIGTPFALQPDPLMLKKSTLEGYKMWHGFFEHTYINRGLTWIALLEPLVNRYNDLYGVEKPTIYTSKFIEMSLRADKLNSSKDELEKKIEELNTEIEDAKDSMMRCQITHLYNEDFFRELLKKDITKTTKKGYTQGFMMIQLDQLNEINKRYGKDTGDEAIKNMVYLLQQNNTDGRLLFKQDGPGVIIYLSEATEEEIQSIAVEARNMINESNLFIQDVTASICTVSLNEINRTSETEEQIKSVFSLLEKRSIIAKSKGNSSIIDTKFELPVDIEGSILLIDEDEVNLNMLNRIFQRLRFDVKIARSVEKALEIIDESPIDIIISEINLSKIDGFSLKQILNESKDYQNIPFIMVSHNKTLENIKRGNNLNVNLILEKPIVPDELIGHVRRFKKWKHSL